MCFAQVEHGKNTAGTENGTTPLKLITFSKKAKFPLSL